MATERIQIIISETGSRTVRRNIQDIGSAAATAEGSVSLLRRALGTLATVGTAIAAARMIDSYTNLQNRLRLVTNNAQELAAVQQSLLGVSQRTRTDLEATTTLFFRLANSTGSLKLSYGDLVGITETVNQAIKISGATTREASNSIIQFGQALASGTLRGDELHSVVEQFPRLASAIGKEFGVAGGQLAAFAKANDGVITTERIIKALRAEAERMGVEFQEITPTIADAFVRVNNALTVFLGGMGQSVGIGKLFNQGADLIIANLDKIALGLTAIAGIAAFNILTAQVLGFGKTLQSVLSLATSGIVNLGRIVMSALVIPFQILAGVIALNPLVLFGTALVAGAIAGFFLFREQIEAVIDRFGGLGNIANSVVGGLIAAAQTIVETWQKIPAALGDLTIQGLNAVLRAIQDFMKNWKQILVNLGKSALETASKIGTGIANIAKAAFTKGASVTDAFQEAFSSLADTTDDGLFQINNIFAGAADDIGQTFNDNLNKQLSVDHFGPIKEQVSGLQDFMKQLNAPNTSGGIFNNELLKNLPNVSTASSDALGGGGKKSRKKSFDDYLKEILDETEAMKLNTRERDVQNQLLDVSQKLRRNLTTTEEQALRTALQHRQALSEENDLYQEINGSIEDNTRKMNTLNRLFDQGRISVDQYNDKLRELRIAQLESSRSLQDGITRGLLKIEQQFGDVASVAEDAMVNSFKSIEDAFVEFATTGKFEFKSLVDSIFADLTRLAVRQSITAPLANLIGGSSGFGGGGGLGGLIGGLFSPNGQSGGLGSLFSGLFKFAEGGDFMVGGRGGFDNNMLSINGEPVAQVSRGERVSVDKNGGGGGKAVNQYFNISTPDANSFKKSQGQIFAGAAMAIDRANRRNN